MGAKTGLLIFSDGEAPPALRGARVVDGEATAELLQRLYPGWVVEPDDGMALGEATYPADGVCYAASFPGVDVICDRRLMSLRPSVMPEHLLEASGGRRVFFHAMHSVSDALTFAVWENGELVRSLSLSPDDGIVENIGAPYDFEAPYWAGEHPVEPDPDWGDGQPAYPLAFHPLELGEEALRMFAGFILEGRRSPADVDPDAVPLNGYRVTNPSGPDPPRARAEMQERVAAMHRHRVLRVNADGTITAV
ncbi:hypothetical protein GA0115240_142153 [Streptomyces sp. DvalAA-14]|uniref:DUF6928 family protein n=1 Tax=unclassified Streptomyces TaxID=2593676 RepID=UPI00081B2A49|nr:MULTISPECIES: hypothetical protein [unclassified Streptomyces]SCE17298.1 hypothetical protein GA0115240_142153 [Streptomyces sp. DvalAA-14]